MTDVQKKFFKRLVLYKMQYVPATIIPVIVWVILLKIVCSDYGTNELACFLGIGWIPSWYFIFNTVTYFYGKRLVKKYGYEVFSDVDPQLLEEHFNVDSKTFGKHYKALMKYRRFAGPYMTAAITLSLFIHSYLAVAVAIACYTACSFYGSEFRNETSGGYRKYDYFDTTSPDFNWSLTRVRGTREANLTGHTHCD